MDDDNAPQPGVLIMLDPAFGGQAQLTEDDYVGGAPEFVCEVAGSTASLDLHAKLAMYRRFGVREYFVRVSMEPAVQWFTRVGDEFTPIQPDADGISRSRVLPGLWLDVPALLAGNVARVNEVVRQGTASAEHAAFVAELARRGARST